ncbi:MAG: IclR family transcriptional regulator [Deltaproteobacteria bacterium]|nr:IclR family transcriptional regulator [Deltaproteobacteria bacterium]
MELKSLSRGLDILLAFSDGAPALGLEEIARAVRIPRSSLYRFLDNLERRGFVRQDLLSRKYSPGVALFRLGMVAAESINLVGAAYPWMQRLADEARESVYLAIREGMDRICIAYIESPHGHIRYWIKPGNASPLYAGASGKVLLAYLPEAEQRSVVASLRPARLAPRTITGKRELGRRLREIRRRGYDFSREELARGTWGIAVPVFDPVGRPVASLTVAGPLFRLAAVKVLPMVQLLKATAGEIARDLWGGVRARGARGVRRANGGRG